MKVTEIEAKTLPFYKYTNLHEYHTAKKKFFEKHERDVAEVSYYASFGIDHHWLLLTWERVRYEVQVENGKIKDVRELTGMERIAPSPLVVELVGDYIQKSKWLGSGGNDEGISKAENLFVKYGKPMNIYEPTYKTQSRFYSVS